MKILSKIFSTKKEASKPIIAPVQEKAKEVLPALSDCYCDLIHTTCSFCKGE